MSTNAIVVAIIAALAPVIAAIVVLFKLNLTQDQQAELVSGLAAIVTVAGTIFASVVHTNVAKVKAAAHLRATAELQAAVLDHVDHPAPAAA